MDLKANYIKQNNQMDNFDLKKYLAENKLEEEKYIGQFGSRSAEKLAMADAKFSNAILALNSDDVRSAELAENAYMALGRAMKDHFRDLFDIYKPHPFIDQI